MNRFRQAAAPSHQLSLAGCLTVPASSRWKRLAPDLGWRVMRRRNTVGAAEAGS